MTSAPDRGSASFVQFAGDRHQGRDPHRQGREVCFRTVPPGVYVVRVEGRDMLPVEGSVTVVVGAAVTADFKLEWINPGPVRLESKFSGDAPDKLPITAATI
jgi:hypothetical protein